VKKLVRPVRRLPDDLLAHPLHCAWFDAEPLGNGAHTGLPRGRQRMPDFLCKLDTLFDGFNSLTSL
jgi:hypothetical protein